MAEVEVVAAKPEPVDPKRKFGVRSFCAGLCLVLGAILMPVGIIGFWGKNTVTSPETVATVVTSTVTDPIVQEEVATWATDQIAAYIQESDVLDSAPQIKSLIDKFGFSLKPFIYPIVLNMVQSVGGIEVLSKILTTAHTAVLNILEGDPPPATAVRDGQVVVDFNSLTTAIKQALAARGIELPEKVTSSDSWELPKNLADNIPDNLRGRLNDATDGAVDKANESLNSASDRVDSAKDSARNQASDLENRLNAEPIVLMNEDQLNQARAIYALTIPIATWLIVVSLVLFAGAIGLSTRRRRMVLITGLMWILAAIIVFIVIALGERLLTNAFEGSLFYKGSEVFYQLLIERLQLGSWIIFALGAIMVLITLALSYRDRQANKKVSADPPATASATVTETVSETVTDDSGNTATATVTTTETVTQADTPVIAEDPLIADDPPTTP